jgi:hypothetical protein
MTKKTSSRSGSECNAAASETPDIDLKGGNVNTGVL